MLDGETLTDPPDTGVTDPTPLFIDALVAFELVQLSVELLPATIVVGLAENVPVGATCVTVTVACRVIGPPGPVSVSV